MAVLVHAPWRVINGNYNGRSTSPDVANNYSFEAVKL